MARGARNEQTVVQALEAVARDRKCEPADVIDDEKDGCSTPDRPLVAEADEQRRLVIAYGRCHLLFENPAMARPVRRQ
jgi:hypothetical protein